MKKIEQDKLLEVAGPELFDGISAEQLQARKVATARVLDIAEQALRDAERDGKTEEAEKLRERIAVLQDMLEHADETDVEDHESESGSGDGGGEGKDKGDGGDPSEKKDEGSGDEGDEGDDGWETTKADDGSDGSGDKEGKEGKDSDGGYKSSITGTGIGGEKAGSSSSSSKGKPEINPFDAKSGSSGKGGGKQPTHEEIFAAAKKILSKLGGEASRGAKDGIKSILSSRGYSESFNKPLTEAIKKTLSTMTEDEFNDELSATLEVVDRVKKVNYSDDLDARVVEIKRKASSAVDRMELEKEDSIHTKDARKALKSYEKENDKYKSGPKMAGLDSFKSSLYRAVRDQVIAAEEEEETWAALNRRHEDDPSIVVKGTRIEDTYDEEGIPTINVYFDQSGSWSDREVEVGKSAIRVINEYHERGDIKLQIYYMSAGGVFQKAEAARGFPAAEGWADALKHIRDSKVQNVIILSDHDLDEYEWNNRPDGNNGVTKVDGCVWWLWKNNSVSKKALKELIGKSGNYQFGFRA